MAKRTLTRPKDKRVFKCSLTGKEVLSKSVPSGWKRFGDLLLCPDAVKQHYTVGCVSIPIRFYDDKDKNKAINDHLNRGFALSTSLANWLITEYYTRDEKRMPWHEKIPAFKKDSLYQAAKVRFPLDIMPSSLIAASEHRIRQVYQKNRYSVIWTGARSLESFRYPYPYHCREQDWSLKVDDDGNMSVSVNIARERITLDLSQSHKYARQRAGLKKIYDGAGKFGELTIIRKRSGEVRCQISGYFPKTALTELQGEFLVRSDKDSLIVALNQKDERLWIFHGDQVRRWSREHQRRLQRLSDDTKFEDRTRSRFDKRKGDEQTVEQSRRKAVTRYRNRMNTLTDQLAIRIVNYAKRRKFSKVVLDFSDQTFVDKFPWHQLKSKITYKAEAAGIGCEETQPKDK